MTASDPTSGASGSTPSFVRRTSDDAAARRATARCAGVSNTAVAAVASTYGCSNNPSRALLASTRRTARSTTSIGTVPSSTLAWSGSP